MSAHPLRIASAALLLAALAMFQPATVQAGEPAAPPDTVALVNGVPLTRDLLDIYARAAMGQPLAQASEEQRTGLLDALIRAEIVAQQAEKLGLSATNELDIPDATQAQIAFGRLQALNRVGYEAFAHEHEPTDSELMGEYQRQIARVPRLQYHAHHILVSTRAAGQHILEQLKGGANFETLAMKESIDPSGQNGGDLGWFSLATMPEPFAAALRTMKKGELPAHPVQSSFGWHVIRLDDTRALAPPSFDSLRDKLADAAREENVRAYLGALLKSADVQKFP
jgi:peptidyl-prolyl cis-trans isomerase C